MDCTETFFISPPEREKKQLPNLMTNAGPAHGRSIKPAVIVPTEKMAMGKVGRPTTSQAQRQPIAPAARPTQIGNFNAPEVIEET